MLVFLSDLHLTDGSSGSTIHPRAFCKFKQMLLNIIGKPEDTKIRKVHLVLLGDIIDVIRSDVWLRQEKDGPGKTIRPWSPATDHDQEGKNLKDYTEQIVQKIISTDNNILCKIYLEEFQTACQKLGVDLELSYLIGNHDWLLNRYPSTRRKVAEFLGMPDSGCYERNPFPEYKEFLEYGVAARHGDCFDSLNFTGHRDASSIGDALVIDLLNHFPKRVQGKLNLADDHPLVVQLREIDNVRPLLDIPTWIRGLCRHFPEVEGQVRGTWNDLVDEFLQLRFVQDLARSQPLLWFLLRFVLRFTTRFSWGGLKKFLARGIIRRFYQRLDDYKAYAYKELKDKGVSYAVYGHTHGAQQTPLTVRPITPKREMEQVYFNSGTWRKVFEATAFETKNCDFIGWYVLTFVVFYLEEEKEPDRNYELWSASLGYGRETDE
jgi:UDP-2,3-diacylglucosamine pyrophosphatase LpxH